MQCSTTRSEVTKEDYYLKQINTTCLSQFSYYIESNGECAIIDPMRESDVYDEIIQQRGSKLKYVFETHFHADFVSGHYELAKKYGATIVFGPNAKADFDIKVAQDNEEISIGKVRVKVLHTPGHTMESSTYLLLDSKGEQQCIFTGDTLFLGEVGRPDLAVKGNNGITEHDLAEMLYNSINSKIKPLNDSVIVYPGHGAGSACGKNISAGSSDTLENQKKTNYVFNENLKKEEFIELLTTNIATPPSYFFHDVFKNKTGYDSMTSVLERSLVPLSLEQFKKFKEDSKVVILDTRDANVVSNGFIPDSILISLKMTYAIWIGTLFSHDTKFIIVAEPGKEKESIIRMARVGFENVIGYLEGGFDTWAKNEKEISKFETKDLDLNNLSNISLFDVREKGEWSRGVIENSNLIALSQLEQNLDKIPKDKDIHLMCQGGLRSVIAISILKKNKFQNNLINVNGGCGRVVNALGYTLKKLV
jgi:hydroxyacylglutathione hydrolase